MERVAVRQLLNEDEPEQFIETIDTMFESWLCSDDSSGTTSSQRTTALAHIKALKRLMNSIK
jgi:hypothetical protein